MITWEKFHKRPANHYCGDLGHEVVLAADAVPLGLLKRGATRQTLTQRTLVPEHLLRVVAVAALPLGVEELAGGARVQSRAGPELARPRARRSRQG